MDNTRPIAESTHIEKSTPATTRPRFVWGGRYTARNRKPLPLPKPESPSKTQNLNRSKIIDAQTYIDTQSPGLVARLVKYHDESQKKTKPIINPLYSRYGDFPLVNTEPSKKPQQSVAPNTTARITPPIRSNYMMQSRAMIMSAGRIGAVADASHVYPNGGAHTSNENEPLVSHGEEETPTRSVLDALKEISRKRIHCDELESDQNKKVKSDGIHNNTVDNEYVGSTNTSLKRLRDRTSPTYQGPIPLAQKKRYSGKCNDIFSSLSSSMHLLTPKRKLDLLYEKEQSAAMEQLKQQQKIKKSDIVDGVQQQSTATVNKPSIDKEDRPEVVDRAETDQSKIVSEKAAATPERPKITLFNRDYSTMKSLDDDDSDAEEEKRNLFVKPKATTSTEFKLPEKQKERAQKTRLAMMLSCLAGVAYDGIDTDTDETDAPTNKSDASEATSTAISTTTVSITSAPTSITFATATTTSILNPILSNESTSSTTVTSTKTNESTTSVSRALNFDKPETAPAVEIVSKPSDAAVPISNSPSVINSSPIISPVSSTLVTNHNAALVTPPSQIISSATLSPAKASGRIGGFSFPVVTSTPTMTSSPTKTAEQPKLDLNATSIPKSNAVPTFSFGTTNKTTATVAPTTTVTISAPTFSIGQKVSSAATVSPINSFATGGSAFSFGQNAPAQPAAVSAQSTPAPLQFAFGNPAPAASVASTTASVPVSSFGIKTAAATVAPAQQTLFGFPAPPPFGNASKPAIGGITFTPSPAFQFDSAPANAQHSFTSPTVTTPTPLMFGAGPNVATTTAAASAPFSFGGNTAAGQNSASIFNPTSTAATTSNNAFASPSLNSSFSQPAANIFGSSTAKPTDQPPAFGAGITKPTFGASSFHGSNQLPGFGSLSTNQPAPIFGGATAPSAFGSNSNNPSSALNTTFTNPSGAFGSDTSAQNPSVLFGSGFGSNQTATTTASAFGIASPQPAALFAFGGNGTATNAAVTTAPPTFGATNSTSAFAFSSPSAPAANQTNNAFFSNAKPEAAVSPFSFNAGPNAQLTTVPTNPTFNFGAKASSPFGHQQGLNQSPASAPSSFASPAASKAFAFGGGPPTAPAAASAFNFGGDTATTSAFNFGGGPPTAPTTAPVLPTANSFHQFNAGVAAQPTNNLFSIGTATGGPPKGSRPIRQATRRINK